MGMIMQSDFLGLVTKKLYGIETIHHWHSTSAVLLDRVAVTKLILVKAL